MDYFEIFLHQLFSIETKIDIIWPVSNHLAMATSVIFFINIIDILLQFWLIFWILFYFSGFVLIAILAKKVMCFLVLIYHFYFSFVLFFIDSS